MKTDDVIERLPLCDWHGPFAPDVCARSIDALESGRLLLLADLPFAVAEADSFLLSPSIIGGERKNISYDPATGAITNTSLRGAEADRLKNMMRRFGDAAEAMLHDLLPAYAPALQRARTSFRSAEIAGRDYSRQHDDRLLHVDAFPSRPMHGQRILRLFSNIAPDGVARAWRVGEPFPEFARQFLQRTGHAVPGSAWFLERLGITNGRRSEYDRIMLRLHDTGKLDSAYQSAAPKLDIVFAAGTTWVCYTDQLLHAALAGHCALEQTFHLPISAMAHPDRSPLRVLEGLTGHRLA